MVISNGQADTGHDVTITNTDSLVTHNNFETINMYTPKIIRVLNKLQMLLSRYHNILLNYTSSQEKISLSRMNKNVSSMAEKENLIFWNFMFCLYILCLFLCTHTECVRMKRIKWTNRVNNGEVLKSQSLLEPVAKNQHY